MPITIPKTVRAHRSLSAQSVSTAILRALPRAAARPPEGDPRPSCAQAPPELHPFPIPPVSTYRAVQEVRQVVCDGKKHKGSPRSDAAGSEICPALDCYRAAVCKERFQELPVATVQLPFCLKGRARHSDRWESRAASDDRPAEIRAGALRILCRLFRRGVPDPEDRHGDAQAPGQMRIAGIQVRENTRAHPASLGSLTGACGGYLTATKGRPG